MKYAHTHTASVRRAYPFGGQSTRNVGAVLVRREAACDGFHGLALRITSLILLAVKHHTTSIVHRAVVVIIAERREGLLEEAAEQARPVGKVIGRHQIRRLDFETAGVNKYTNDIDDGESTVAFVLVVRCVEQGGGESGSDDILRVELAGTARARGACTGWEMQRIEVHVVVSEWWWWWWW